MRDFCAAQLLIGLILLAACSSDPITEMQNQGDPIEVSLEGNTEVSNSELLKSARAELESFFKNGRRPADLDDASHAMRQHLLDLGYVDSRVSFELDGEDSGREQVRFDFNEGQRFNLGKVEFSGNTLIGNNELRPYFAFSGSGLLGMGQTLFRADRLAGAARALESLYLSRGFLKVKVSVDRQERHVENSTIDVLVEVEEGPQYFISAIDLQFADDSTDTTELLDLCEAEVGEPFSPRVVSRVESGLRRKLADRGHLLSEIKRKLRLDEDAKKAAIEFQIIPGPKLRLGEVKVEGQERTDLDFILDRLDLEHGEVLTQTRLDSSLNRLYATGLFDRVKINTISETEGSPRWLESDVDVELSEIPARSVDFELGYGSYELLRGQSRYRDRNLFGAGRDFEAGLSASFRHFGADIRFLDPYTLGGPNTLQFNLAVQRRDFRSHVSNSVDARLSVRHIFNSRMEVETGYRLRLADATDSAFDAGDPDQQEFLTSALFARFVYDGRDDVLLPTEGFFFAFAVDWSTGLLGSDRDFVGLSAEFSWLFELGEGTILAIGAEADTRHLLDDGPTLPIQERFFLGGESTIRSFEEGDLGPTDRFGDPIGGLSSLQAHIELRQQIVGDFQVALFYELGAIDRDSFAMGDLGHAVGLGLRYLLPFGPARLDFGYNPSKRFASDRNWALHFAFGFSF